MDYAFFSKEVELRFCDCDYKGRAKLSTILGYLADIAGLAYREKGFSHQWLWDRNFVFLVSRVSLHIERMPTTDETIKVNTWECGTKGMLFDRKFSIYDSANKKIIEAKTQWLLADPITRSLLRPSSFTGIIDDYNGETISVIEPSKLKTPPNCESIGERLIRYSDIDANGHVYNGVYASISCDFLDNSFIERDIADFRINFKHEAKLGDIIELKTACIDNQVFIVGEVDSIVSYETEFTFV